MPGAMSGDSHKTVGEIGDFEFEQTQFDSLTKKEEKEIREETNHSLNPKISWMEKSSFFAGSLSLRREFFCWLTLRPLGHLIRIKIQCRLTRGAWLANTRCLSKNCVIECINVETLWSKRRRSTIGEPRSLTPQFARYLDVHHHGWIPICWRLGSKVPLPGATSWACYITA